MDAQATIEVERVVNLVRGFGWDKIKEEIDGKDVIITIKKPMLTATEATGSGGPM